METMVAVDTDLLNRSLTVIHDIVRAQRVVSRALEKAIGLSLAQLSALQAIAAEPDQSLNEVATRTRTHQSSASVVVRHLITRGLVTREPSVIDKRRIVLNLTDAGGAVLRDAPVTVEQRLAAAFPILPGAIQEYLALGLEDWWATARGGIE